MNTLIDEATAMPEAETKVKKRVGTKLLAIAVFIILFLAAALVLNDVVRQKWSYSYNAAQQIVKGFYEEPDHSIDVLCLGASGVRNGVSALEMFQNYGFTTYSRASSIQLPVVSYHLLRESLATQSPKALVLDATTFSSLLLDNGESLEGKLHEAIDYMPWSKYKYEMIRDIQESDLGFPMRDFMFPLFTYHDRWEELDKDDFSYRSWKKYVYKGQYPAIRTVSNTLKDGYMDNDYEVDEAFYITEDGRAYLQKIVDICNENGIFCVLVKAPSTKWSNYRHDIIADLADENGIAFVDFNLLEVQNEIGFNPKQDYADTGSHLNVTGAKKLSSYLGQYLSSHCAFEDRRQDPAFDDWDTAYAQYQNLLVDVDLMRETNLIAFVEKLKNPNYLTMIATRDDNSLYFNDDVRNAFAGLGVTAPFQDYSFLSYVALLDGTSFVYQAADEDPLDNDNVVTYSTRYDGHSISLSSNANQLTSNSALISFDGEALSPDSKGFNFVVYDKSVDLIVTRKAFHTGIGGKDFTEPNMFTDAQNDPVTYLDLVGNDDYITVIGLRGSGGDYIPGPVNQKLADIGLIQLDGDQDRPYLAILDGSDVIYNEYGEPDSELIWEGTVGGYPVSAISSTVSGQENYFSIIGSDRLKSASDGFLIHVYSKSHDAVVARRRFIWSTNFVTGVNYSQITNLRELLSTAVNDNADILCLYAPDLSSNGISENVRSALNDYGFTDITRYRYYAGYRTGSGEMRQKTGWVSAELQYSTDTAEVAISAASGNLSGTFGGSVYQTEDPGVYIIVYNADNNTVLDTRSFLLESSEPDNPLTAARSDPPSFLELLASEDYITVIGASRDASKFIPEAINDKLTEMGLLPLDGEFNRPYLAILDGGEILYNRYGWPGTSLSTAVNSSGVQISGVSNLAANTPYFFAQIDEVRLRTTGSGIGFLVYSKSEQREVMRYRYDWSTNTASGVNYGQIANIHELLATAKFDNADVLCIYKPEAVIKTPNDEIVALQSYGFTELKNHGYYVGCVQSGGTVTQSYQEDAAALQLTRSGVPITLTSSEENCAAVINGVTYHTETPGLYVLLYHSELHSVLSEKIYASQDMDLSASFEEVQNDPVACLELLRNPDYISMISVSIDGTEYIPGSVNDKLVEMGLLPLDGQYGQPYLAVLNGTEVLYNAYGNPGGALDFFQYIDGTSVYAVSSALYKGHKAYIWIGAENYQSAKVGFTIFVYSKQAEHSVFVKRYNWSQNYATGTNFSTMTDLGTILTTATHEGDDILCLYSCASGKLLFTDEELAALRACGITPDQDLDNYVAAVRHNGITESYNSDDPVSMTVKGDRGDVQLSVEPGALSAKLRYTSFQFEEDGLYILLYNSLSDTVLRVISCGTPDPAGVQ